MVQTNVFVPTLNPVICEIGEATVAATAALGAKTVQLPDPTAGAFAAIVAVVKHTV